MKYLHTLFLAALLAACSNDDMDAVVSPVEPTVVSLPQIELVTGHPQPAADSGTRTGDPGVDDELELPDKVYIFMWIEQSNGKYTLDYIYRRNAKNNWVETPDPQKPDNRRYFLKSVQDYTINLDAVADKPGAIGKWYVIATDKELADTDIKKINSSLNTDIDTGDNYYKQSLTDITANPDATIKAAVLDLTGWTSADLCQLYSTPVGDTELDPKGYLNGEIKRGEYTDTEGNTQTGVRNGNIRLYHAAAKIDFQWEVPADKQATTAIEKITVSSLPTQCKIFEPTKNPDPTGTHTKSYPIGDDSHPINAGNKWIGREYFYALEPADGKISYEVTISGRENTVSTSFTPAQKNQVFTGWYRIRANVK